MCIGNTTVVWPKAAYCLHGTCNTTSNTCICDDGFVDDLFFYRQRNCIMKQDVLYGVFCCVIIISLAGMIYSLYSISESGKTARNLFTVAFISSFTWFVFAIENFLSSFKTNSQSILLFYLCLSTGYSMSYIVLYSLSVPLFKIADVSDSSFVNLLKIKFTFFRFVGLCISFIMIIKYDDYHIKEYDYSWNLLISISFILYGLEGLVLLTVIVVTGRKMCLLIESIVESSPNDPKYNTSISTMEKIRRLLKNLIVFFPIILVAGNIIPIIYLSAGSLPFSYIIFSIAVLVIPLGAIVGIIFGRRQYLIVPTKIGDTGNDVKVDEYQTSPGVGATESFLGRHDFSKDARVTNIQIDEKMIEIEEKKC